MLVNKELMLTVLLAMGLAFVITFASTPIVKSFAQKIGAMDVPREARRIHDHPIPRMGGLAIFFGFVLSVVIFAEITRQVQGILIGAVIIVATGAVDDIIPLNAWVKFVLQIVAAVVAVLHGVVIEIVMNPFLFSNTEHIGLGILSIPVTILWIVGITNTINLIDGQGQNLQAPSAAAPRSRSASSCQDRI